MVITAERASEGATIYSADARGHFEHVPNQFAVEADITLDAIGSGMFPAFWFRPVSGRGELDVWEYCGAYLGRSNEMKSTLIKTGSSSSYKLGSEAFGIPKASVNGGNFAGLHRWRYEKTAGAGAGSWNSQFEAGEQGCLRFTYQVGDGTNAHLSAPIPAAWRTSKMKVSRLVVYQGK